MTSRTSHTISNERIQQLQILIKRLKIVDFESTFKNENHLNNLAILNEALTHTSAKAGINHERLEFLGDAVLRLAASEFIDNKFPDMKVGERSALRSHLVSDNWLTKVGRSIKIEKVLIVGQKATGDKSALTTLKAEATEALIGALYECYQELEIMV